MENSFLLFSGLLNIQQLADGLMEKHFGEVDSRLVNSVRLDNATACLTDILGKCYTIARRCENLIDLVGVVGAITANYLF